MFGKPNSFCMLFRHDLPLTVMVVDICTDGIKGMLSNTAGALPQNKAVAPNWTGSHFVLMQSHTQKYVLKNVIDGTLQIINSSKAHSLSMHPFNILCDKMGSPYKALMLHTEVQGLPPREVLVQQFECQAELAALFHGTSFY